MSETVKLIIEIPTDFYEITKAKVDRNMISSLSAISIAHGTLLDDVKAEIENRSYGIANDSVIQGEMYERRAVLEILDNIGKGDKE